ncbi:hypothetical protein bgla_1p0580 (plasmid) [Burkholderia gladioli BSR3]|uniref:Transcription factor LuxR-like autoinducer-binding domain-containing protein n=3 Tax=Burkholderia gladioli TaxID=28095 RepID=F2LRG9_BURGS|nr:hypothetical protein bgla_1p0580 [Burkholderia gladioli BSR3]
MHIGGCMGWQTKRPMKIFSSRGLGCENSIRIYEQGADILIERETMIGAGREGEVSFTLMYADAALRVKQLIDKDPNNDLGMRAVEFLNGQVQARPAKPAVKTEPARDPLQTLAAVRSEAELRRTISELTTRLGAVAFCAMYVNFDPQTRQPRTHVALVDGDRGFFQLYVQRRWFAIDALLTHALASNRPIYSSTTGLLENLQGSWYDMGVAARQHGLCSWAGFPTHRPGTHDFGVLYLASPVLPADGGERPFQESAMYLRGLAAEIFDWQLAARRARDIEACDFNSRDLRVLKAVAAGNTAKDIASVLELSERDVLKRIFPEVVAKSGSRNIRDAARYAADRGLLPTLDGKKLVYVAVSDLLGVYLGSHFGKPLWSKPDPAARPGAFAFATETEGREILGSIGVDTGYRFVGVEVEQSAETVSEEACMAFGLPGWSVCNTSAKVAPAENAPQRARRDSRSASSRSGWTQQARMA